MLIARFSLYPTGFLNTLFGSPSLFHFLNSSHHITGVTGVQNGRNLIPTASLEKINEFFRCGICTFIAEAYSVLLHCLAIRPTNFRFLFFFIFFFSLLLSFLFLLPSYILTSCHGKAFALAFRLSCVQSLEPAASSFNMVCLVWWVKRGMIIPPLRILNRHG
jgi:hypothetical protein